MAKNSSQDVNPGGIGLLRLLLEVSRPAMWFVSIFGYMCPMLYFHRWDAMANFRFWYGILYVSFPLNLCVFGWNDIVDTEVDCDNARKGSLLHGAKATKEQLKVVPKAIFLSQVPFWFISYLLIGPSGLILHAALLAANYVYNHPTWGLRGVPPFEYFVPQFMMVTWHWSSVLNGVEFLPLACVIHGVLWICQLHGIEELIDSISDAKGGRRTLATVFGTTFMKFFLFSIMAGEAFFLSRFANVKLNVAWLVTFDLAMVLFIQPYVKMREWKFPLFGKQMVIPIDEVGPLFFWLTKIVRCGYFIHNFDYALWTPF